MFRSLYIMAAVLVVLGTGLAHGLWTNRWLNSDEPGASAARLDNLPLDIGDWHGRELKMDPGSLAIGQIVNFKSRVYANLQTRAEFNVLVVCGRPGPISVHTPEVCFPGAGFQIVSEPLRVSLPLADDLPEAEFKTARFKRQNSSDGTEMEAFWAWTTDGRWQAPNSPRWTFGRFPALYKVYVTHKVAAGGESPEESLKIARAFMIELTRCVMSKPQ
jgi:hypothetical protein